MDRARRDRLSAEVLRGYAHGPGATEAATEVALARVESARCVVLVEGVSDLIALETLAERHGRRLVAEGVVILPIGGAQAAGRYVTRFGPRGAGARLVGLCDVGEERVVARALESGGIGTAQSRDDMERLGFFVCVDDLEDELIRAAGRPLIERVLESHGDLVAFRTLQRQPGWRDAPFGSQVHRWIRAGARRNLRYARLLVEALDLDRAPQPLTAILAATR